MTIQHAEDTPRPDAVYRCPVCHLELVVDNDNGTPILSPLTGERPMASTPPPARTEPNPSNTRKRQGR